MRPNRPLLALTRFALAFIVMACHVGASFHNSVLLTICSLLGESSVRGFLLVSGYSIAHSTSKDPRGYLMRRVERIYPTYLLCLIVAVVPFAIWGETVSGYGVAHLPTVPVFIGNLLMLQVLVCRKVDTIAQNWSLSIECLYYLLAPLFLRLPVRWLMGIAGASATLFYAHDWLHLGFWYDMIGPLAPAGLLWAWLAGWMIYRTTGPERQVVIVAVLMMEAAEAGAGSRATIFTTALVLLALTQGHRVNMPAMVKRAAIYAGDISYPLYLIHISSIVFVFQLWPNASAWVAVGVSLALSAAVLHTVNGAAWLREKVATCKGCLQVAI